MSQSDPTTVYTASPQRSELVDVLERYLCDLENGEAPDERRLLADHPDFADELRPYLDSLRMLHGATRDLRPKTDGADGNEPARRQIGDYRIVREIGRGGMGIVYEAHQISLNRQVALKILPFAAVLDQRQIARFRNEAQAAAQLIASDAAAMKAASAPILRARSAASRAFVSAAFASAKASSTRRSASACCMPVRALTTWAR